MNTEMPKDMVEFGGALPEKWWVVEKGNAIQGKLLERGEMRSGDRRAYYRIELTAECGVKGKGRDAPAEMAEPGEIVGIGERTELESLAEFANGANEVWLMPTEQVPIGGGKTVWRFKKGVKAL